MIKPKTPGVVDFQQTSAVASTYYTILSVAGSGVVNNIGMWCNGGNLNVRITIDGTTTVSTINSSASMYARGFQLSTDKEFFPNAYFSSTLLIEVMTTSTSSPTLSAWVNYSLC